MIAPAEQLHAVARAQHCGQGVQAHQRDDRADDAGGGGKHGAGDQRGHRERAGQARQRQVQAAGTASR